MIPNNIKQYLDDKGVAFHSSKHERKVAAQQVAAVAHISGRKFAKTVVLQHNGDYVLAAVPAAESIDLGRLRTRGGGEVDLASEEEFERLFPSCEVGAMPPLGGLYGLPVVADECLARQDSIAVNAGSHEDVIEMKWSDYERLEHPQMISH